MRQVLVPFASFVLGLGIASLVSGADEAIRLAVEQRIPILGRWAKDPVIVRSVRQANAKPRSTRTIEEMDRRWQANAGIDDFMRSLMTNAGAGRLHKLCADFPEITEAFVTDRLGANVAMTNKTSDYWQGDEDKFTKAIAGGRKGFHIDPISFDESIQAYAVQIAVPVWSGDQAAGVMVLTINLEKLEELR